MFIQRLQIFGSALYAFRLFASTPIASATKMVRFTLNSYSLVGIGIACVAIAIGFHLTRTIEFGLFSWLFPQTESKNNDWKSATSIYDFTVKDIKGEDVSLEKYRYALQMDINYIHL